MALFTFYAVLSSGKVNCTWHLGLLGKKALCSESCKIASADVSHIRFSYWIGQTLLRLVMFPPRPDKFCLTYISVI